jgi:hypothetical protein
VSISSYPTALRVPVRISSAGIKSSELVQAFCTLAKFYVDCQDSTIRRSDRAEVVANQIEHSIQPDFMVRKCSLEADQVFGSEFDGWQQSQYFRDVLVPSSYNESNLDYAL